jgi:NAD(P) transhydrogenase subunit beta
MRTLRYSQVQFAPMSTAIINLAYLLAVALFVLGLKGLSHPRTAV